MPRFLCPPVLLQENIGVFAWAPTGSRMCEPLDAEVLGKRCQFSLADIVRELAVEDDFASVSKLMRRWGHKGEDIRISTRLLFGGIILKQVPASAQQACC